MYRKHIFILLVTLTISSCINYRDKWHSTRLIYDFYLEWEYTPKSQAISIGSWSGGVGGNEIITDQTVFAVGYDSSFIIAKLHPDRIPAIKKELFCDTNSKGDYSLASTKDTIYLDDDKYNKDSVYQENGKWYHSNKFWSGSLDSLYLDKTRTIYYIINIKNYSDMWDLDKSITIYQNKKDFDKDRKKLGVSNDLKFTIINSKLE